MPSRYEERIRIIEKNSSARNQAINNVQSIIENGAKLVNQVGNIYGSQQATEWNNNFTKEFEKAKESGRFDYRIENGIEVRLTSDEIDAEYNKFVNEMMESAPKNPWAQGLIKKSLDGQYSRNIITAYQSNIQHFEEIKSKETETYFNNVLQTDITNATAYNQQLLSNFSYDYESLDEYAKGLFDAGDAVSSKLLSLYLFERNYGESPEVSKQFAEANRNNIAVSQFRDDAYVSFKQNVIDGGMPVDEWKSSLSKEIGNIGVNGAYGANIDLTEDAETRLYNTITTETTKMLKAEWERNDNILNESIKPVMQVFRDSNRLFTTEEAEQLERQYGLNPNLLSPEIKTLYDDFKTNQDSINVFINALNEADAIANKPLADSLMGEIPEGAMTAAEKQAEYDRIAFENLANYPQLQTAFKKYNDSTPYYAHYSQFSREQIINELSDTFIMPTLDMDLYSMDESDAGNPEMDQDIQALLSNESFVSAVTQVALSTDPDVLVSGAYDFSFLMDLWESTLTDAQKTDYRADFRTDRNSAYGMMAFDNETQKQITGQEFSPEDRINRPSLYMSEKANTDFYNWLTGIRQRAIDFVSRYGDMEFADGTTLSSLIESQRSEITSTKSNISNGNHYTPGTDAASDYLQTEAAKQIFANTIGMDSNQLFLYLNEVGHNLTKEEYDFIMDFNNPENGYKSLLDTLGINSTLMGNRLGISGTDRSTIEMFCNAIYENADLIIQAKHNPSLESQLSDKIFESMKQEYEAAIGTPFGSYVNDSFKGYTYDEFVDLAKEGWKSGRYTDPNAPTSDLINRAITETVNLTNTDTVMAAAVYNSKMSGVNADAAAISDEDAAFIFLAHWFEYDIKNPAELTDENKQMIWNMFNDLDDNWKSLGGQYIQKMMGVRGTIAELHSDMGIDVNAMTNDGRFIVIGDGSAISYITPHYDNKGNITGVYYKDSNDQSFGDGINLFEYYIGSGRDTASKMFNNELSGFADWNQVYMLLGEDKTQEIWQMRADDLYQSEKWQQYDSIAKKVFGHSLYPVSMNGRLSGHGMSIKLTDSSYIQHNSSGIDFIQTQNDFADDIISSIPDSIRRGFSAGRRDINVVQEYADEIIQNDKWQKFIKQYEEDNPGKTLGVEVSFSSDNSLARISKGNGANIISARFVERSK